MGTSFMTELSSVITNWPAASVNSVTPAAARPRPSGTPPSCRRGKRPVAGGKVKSVRIRAQYVRSNDRRRTPPRVVTPHTVLTRPWSSNGHQRFVPGQRRVLRTQAMGELEFCRPSGKWWPTNCRKHAVLRTPRRQTTGPGPRSTAGAETRCRSASARHRPRTTAGGGSPSTSTTPPSTWSRCSPRSRRAWCRSTPTTGTPTTSCCTCGTTPTPRP